VGVLILVENVWKTIVNKLLNLYACFCFCEFSEVINPH